MPHSTKTIPMPTHIFHSDKIAQFIGEPHKTETTPSMKVGKKLISFEYTVYAHCLKEKSETAIFSIHKSYPV